jgi:bifunctional non-homologous end joining protein LigD
MIRSPSKPPGFIRPCLPALANRPPPGLDWLHEIKLNGHRVIARKDGERVRLWARTRSDYSDAFTRIREAVAALPVESAVLDGEAIVLRPDKTSDFEGLGSLHGQAEAVLLAYDLMEVDGHDVRPESLEERRTRLAKLLSRKNKTFGDGIQLSEAIIGDGAVIFSPGVLDGPGRHRLEARRLALC